MSLNSQRDRLLISLNMAYQKISTLNATTRKINAVRAILFMKRDKAKAEIDSTARRLLTKITLLQGTFNKELSAAVDNKVKVLAVQIQNLFDQICVLGEMCVEAEKVLKTANEDELAAEGKQLTDRFLNILRRGSEWQEDEMSLHLDDSMFLEFVAGDIENTIKDSSFGRICVSSEASSGTSTPSSIPGSQVRKGSSVHFEDNIKEVISEKEKVIPLTDSVPPTTPFVALTSMSGLNSSSAVTCPPGFEKNNLVYVSRTPIRIPDLRTPDPVQNVIERKDLPLDKSKHQTVEQNEVEKEYKLKTDVGDNSIPEMSTVMSVGLRKRIHDRLMAASPQNTCLFQSDLEEKLRSTSPECWDNDSIEVSENRSQETRVHAQAHVRRLFDDDTDSQPQNKNDNAEELWDDHLLDENLMRENTGSNSKIVQPTNSNKSVVSCLESSKQHEEVKIEETGESWETQSFKSNHVRHKILSERGKPVETLNMTSGQNAVDRDDNWEDVRFSDIKSDVCDSWEEVKPANVCTTLNDVKSDVSENWEEVKTVDLNANWKQVSMASACENWDKVGSVDMNSNWKPAKMADARKKVRFDVPENWDEIKTADLDKSFDEVKPAELQRACNNITSVDVHENWNRFKSVNVHKNLDEVKSVDECENWDEADDVNPTKPPVVPGSVCAKTPERSVSPSVELYTWGKDAKQIETRQYELPSPTEFVNNSTKVQESEEEHLDSGRKKRETEIVSTSQMPAQNVRQSHISVTKRAEQDSVPPYKMNSCPVPKNTPYIDLNRLVFASNCWSALSATLVKKIGHLQKGHGEGFFFPIGIGCNSKGDLFVADNGNDLVKVIRNGSLLFTIGNHVDRNFSQSGISFFRPSAVVVNEREEIFVKDDVGIFKFDPEGTLVLRIGHKTLKKPYGLALTQHGHLVTLDVTRTEHLLYLFHQNGAVFRSSLFGPIMNNVAGSKCRFLAVYKETLLVSDLGLSVMYLANLHGQVYHCFGYYGSGPGMLREPSGITVDSAGNWMIADSKNDRIQVFSHDGQYLFPLKLSDAIYRPSDIMLTQDGQLLVVNYLTHCVKVYRLG